MEAIKQVAKIRLGYFFKSRGDIFIFELNIFIHLDY